MTGELLADSPILAVLVGIGLAAATGFRVFLPLLVAGLAARWGALPLAAGFEWLASPAALVTLATASVVEIAAYYVPGIDYVLDLLAGPAALAAGVVASAAVMVDLPPTIMWPLAVIGGGGVATLTKITSALVRATSGVVTGGLANPVVSTGETAGAAVLAVAAIVLPLLALLTVAALLLWMRRRSRRLWARRAPEAASRP